MSWRKWDRARTSDAEVASRGADPNSECVQRGQQRISSSSCATDDEDVRVCTYASGADLLLPRVPPSNVIKCLPHRGSCGRMHDYDQSARAKVAQDDLRQAQELTMTTTTTTTEDDRRQEKSNREGEMLTSE